MIKRIDMKLGFQCNNFCRFCIQASKRNTAPNKSVEDVKSVLKKEKNRCNEVIFTGGEPTIYKNLIDYVKYAKELGYENIHMQTNGRLFSKKEYCVKLSEAGANIFSLSIHGSNAKIHDYLTRTKNSWNQVIRAIENLKEINQQVQTNSVIVRQNYKDLPSLAEILISIGVHQFQFAFIHINSIIQKDKKLIKEIVPRYYQVEPYVKEGLQLGINANIHSKTEAIPYCFMKGYENHISEKNIPDTDVYDANKIIKNYEKVRITEGKAKGPNCKKCKYNNICEGPWREYPEIFGWDEFKPVR